MTWLALRTPRALIGRVAAGIELPACIIGDFPDGALAIFMAAGFTIRGPSPIRKLIDGAPECIAVRPDDATVH
jgi:hypothetical protein